MTSPAVAPNNAVTGYGVNIQSLANGQLAWRVKSVRHLTPDENRGRHHVFVNALDRTGQRVRGTPVIYGWDGGQSVTVVLDKPDNEPMGNIPLFGASIWLKVVDSQVPSETVTGLSSHHPDEPGSNGEIWNSWGHHSFVVEFQLGEKSSDFQPVEPPPPPPPTPPAEPDPGPQPVPYPFFPQYVYGLHEPGGEALMLQAGKPGWLLCLAEIGLDGTVMADYRSHADRGFGVVVRINHGYGLTGTLPTPDKYPQFAKAVHTFVGNSKGCSIWVIGNEPNHQQEWPQNVPILPQDYARCYDLCREAIHSIPGREHDLVLIAGIAPWNNLLTYPENPSGDWVQYFRDVVAKVKACDGFALHTYTHRHDPDQIWENAYHQTPGYTHLRNEFHTVIDWLEAIPDPYRNLPVLVTETNPVEGWFDTNNGWVQQAYKFIDQWNQGKNRQKIQALILYRWPLLPDQPQWSILKHPGVGQDFLQAMQHSDGHKVYLPVLPNQTPAAGPQVPAETYFTTAPLNVRQGPGTGYTVLRVLPFGTPVKVILRADEWAKIGSGEWVSLGFLSKENPVGQSLVETQENRWLIEALARLFKVDPRTFRAVLRVESGGNGFRDGRLVIRNELHMLYTYFADKALFDRHFNFNRNPRLGDLDHLWRRDEAAPWQSPHENQQAEWECFEFARSLYPAAVNAISMGMAQVMGFNHQRLNYPSAQAMLEDFSDPIHGSLKQLVSIFSYCYNTKGLIEAIQRQDWTGIARLYNGDSVQTDTYARLLQEAFSAEGSP